MIICINAECEGGNTIFHINDFFKYSSKNSSTNDHILVFRKDLCHEGEMLKSGYKEIITLNLWAIKKEDSGALVVKGDDFKYIIPHNRIAVSGDTYFSSLISFKDNTTTSAINTCEVACTKHEFDVIYRIMMGCYITMFEYFDNRELIDFFAINKKNLLLTGSVSQAVYKSPVDFTDNVIICPTEQDTMNLLSTVKEQSLPYIPFMMIMCEGFFGYGGGMSGTQPSVLNMIPVWFSVGELNNIHSWSNVITKGDVTFQLENEKMSWKNNLDRDLRELDEVDYRFMYSDLYGGDVTEPNNLLLLTEDDVPIFGFDFCLPSVTNESIINRIITNDGYYDLSGNFQYVKNIPVSYANKYWSQNSDGKMFLNIEQGESLIHVLKNLEPKLEDTIKMQLASSGFIFPQRKEVISKDFCNESIYGSCTLMKITGLLNCQGPPPL